MARKEKPYRVYRGGRERGSKKPPSREQTPFPLRSPDGNGGAPPTAWGGHAGHGARPPEPPWRDELDLPGPPEQPVPPPPPRRRTARRVAFWTGMLVFLVLLVVAGWGAFGFLAFRGGVKEANERLPNDVRAVLDEQKGSLLTSPTTILLIGVDTGAAREGQGRADALVLVRTDPDNHRIAMLSIPRDLRVDLEGVGPDKINAAYARGGASLAVRAVTSLTGLAINHVAIVDFASFHEVIDQLGGITVDVPKPILANKFDCPLKSPAECDRWPGWRFEQGPQEMTGQRALVYARVRENLLDPTESDVTRGGRQQQVVQAIIDELGGVRGFVRLPFVGNDVVRPLATDLTATQLLELGWVKFRAADDATLKCRLGGQPIEIDGVFYLQSSEENVSVAHMVTGDTAPQPPPPNQGPFAPGCVVGK